MKSKLLLCCAFVMLFVSRISAQDATVWHLATDSDQYIPIEQVECMLFVDDSNLFSVLKTNGEIVSDIRFVYFRNVPLAVESLQDDAIDVSLFPNPVVSDIYLRGIKDNALVQVLSLDGALILQAEVAPAEARINVASLPAGAYLLKVNNTVVKFIKK